jgi:23S rRNA (adenine-N6)-dimethyltransferase
VPGRPPAAPNPAGAHFLRDRALIARLVRASGAGPGELVFDLGAGYGAITAALAASGARVIAVERDERLAGRLRRRFDGHQGIRVVEADLRLVPLPRRDFLVVANPPFSVTTALCRRLLGDPAVPLAGAELILQWGAARWLANPVPRDAETAWWACRYQVTLTRRISAASFRPRPAADAAQVSVRRRPGAAPAAAQRELRRLQRAAYARSREPLDRALSCLEPGGRRVPGSSFRALAAAAGVSPRMPAALLTAEDWYQLGRQLAGRSADPAGAASARGGRS